MKTVIFYCLSYKPSLNGPCFCIFSSFFGRYMDFCCYFAEKVRFVFSFVRSGIAFLGGNVDICIR